MAPITDAIIALDPNKKQKVKVEKRSVNLLW